MQSNQRFKKLIGSSVVSCGSLVSLVALVFVCVPFLVITYAGGGNRSVMKVENVVITTKPDENSSSLHQEISKISQGSERIYAVITLRGLLDIPFDSTLWL